jgi:hypothetical protein
MLYIWGSSRKVLGVGRHAAAKRRRKSSVVKAAVLAPASFVVAAASGSAYLSSNAPTERAVAEVAPWTAQIVAVAPTGVTPGGQWRVYDREAARVLPKGVAPEQGLQVETILASRSLTAAFPQITDIGGVRPDALRWHPNGLALDVMIPNPSSAEGIALGDRVVAFALENWDRFKLNHVIWRGTFYTRSGPEGTASGHYDHVHIATNGGGYPTGSETYLR